MKKYKTSEAIAMLEQNPKLGFLNNKGITLKTLYHSVRFYEGDNNVQRYGIALGAEWELIQQPVDFLTALKAYSEGKTIRSEFAGCKWLYVPRKDGNGWITDENGNPVGREEILQGTWHIEEGESNE